uniref:Uncharacterized protein n=1 Tax=Lepeophtheirus salmonis TaxID=72036 RepID=A0A0K2UB98_LEPSM
MSYKSMGYMDPHTPILPVPRNSYFSIRHPINTLSETLFNVQGITPFCASLGGSFMM